MRTLKYIITGVAAALSVFASAQDPATTQPFSMPIELNPALMGLNQDIYASTGYKSQWANIEDGFSTIKATAMMPLIYNKPGMGKLDAGISFVNDKAGGFSSNYINLAVSYDIKVNDNNHLSGALCGGYINKGFDFNSQTWGDQYQAGSYNPSNGTSQTNLNDEASIVDAGFGLLWYYQPEADSIMAFAGLSGYHFYSPEEGMVENSTESLAPRYNFIGGMKFITALNLDVAPNIRIQAQDGSNDLAYGVYLDYHLQIGPSKAVSTEMLSGSSTETTPEAPAKNSTITFGMWYNQQSKTASYLFGFLYDKYALCYSYNFGPQGLKESAFQTSTHEISLAFKMNRTGKKTISPVSMW